MEGTLRLTGSSTGMTGPDGASRSGRSLARSEPRSRPRTNEPARSNADWLAELRSVGRPAREAAVEDLSTYLRAGLAKAFAGEASVQPADLDDFTQDALVRILGALDSFRGDSRFTTWAMAVGLRVAYSTLRRRRSAHISLDDLERFGAGIEEASGLSRPEQADRRVERSELLAALQRAIEERLTQRQRTAILAELQGVSSERLVELLGTNRNALYKLYHDARKNLRRALNDFGFSDEAVRRELMREVR